MMKTQMFRWLVICILVLLPGSSAETAACRKVYREGGAMAVVLSPQCPRWGHSFSWGPLTDETMVDCSQAIHQTLGRYFADDRIFCDVDIKFPLHRLDLAQKEATFGIVAVFDGYYSNEDSEMAWMLIQEYFFLHTYFLFDATYVGRLEGLLPDNFGASFHIKILKEALVRAIYDIDLAFSKNGYAATIILMVDDHIYITSLDGSGERIPEAAAGSYNSWLAASLSVCEVSSRRLDVISPFNVTNIHLLSSNGSCLVAMSSMRLKRLMSQGLCDALRETYSHDGSKLFSCVYLFKDSMEKTGFEGCTDNMVAVSVPVQTTFYWNRLGGGWGIDLMKKLIYKGSANTISLIMQAEAAKLGHVSLAKKVSQKDIKDDIADLRQAPWYGLSQCQCKLAASDVDENMCKIGMDILDLLDSMSTLNDCSTSSADFQYKIPSSRYVLERRLGQGGFGETWLASYLNCSKGENAEVLPHEDQEDTLNSFCLDPQNLHSRHSALTHDCHSSTSYGVSFIIKRVMVERGSGVYLSGLREKYFGEVFLNASLHDKESVEHVARYIQSLDCGVEGMWLVFLPEGVSLSKLLYTTGAEKATVEESEGVHNVRVLQQSSYWYWLKTTEQGREQMRSLIKQLLMALKFCHDRSIIHRDIKPGNMVLCFENETNGRCSEQRPSADKRFHTKMRIIDFGSAVDEFTRKHLYGLYGPSSSEQTYDYTPPEALLNASWFQGSTSIALKYDLWSVGVVALEMILGSPDVFHLNHRSYAVLILQFGSLDEDEIKLLLRLRSFADMCNKMPGDSEHFRSWREKIADGTLLASSKCSEEFLSRQIRKRDPLKLGFPNDLALQLVRRLLTWAPTITARQRRRKITEKTRAWEAYSWWPEDEHC